MNSRKYLAATPPARHGGAGGGAGSAASAAHGARPPPPASAGGSGQSIQRKARPRGRAARAARWGRASAAKAPGVTPRRCSQAWLLRRKRWRTPPAPSRSASPSKARATSEPVHSTRQNSHSKRPSMSRRLGGVGPAAPVPAPAAATGAAAAPPVHKNHAGRPACPGEGGLAQQGAPPAAPPRRGQRAEAEEGVGLRGARQGRQVV